jgi:hypothetical protein
MIDWLVFNANYSSISEIYILITIVTIYSVVLIYKNSV